LVGGSGEGSAKYQEQANALADKLEGYVKDYTKDNKPEYAAQATATAQLLRAGEYQKAYEELWKGDLRYDIPNTATAVVKVKEDAYISSTFGEDWGMKAGTYSVWRSGDLDSVRGVFFSIDEQGAKAYSSLHNDAPALQYETTIQKPLVADDLIGAYSQLTGRSVESLRKQRDNHPNVAKWWRDVDKKVFELAKKQGYDAITYTKPAAPALREMVVIDKKALKANAKQFAFTTSANKVTGFMSWLEDMNDRGVLDLYLTSDKRTSGRKAWERVYIDSAYKKGMALSEKEMRKKGIIPSKYASTPAFPVDSAFNMPIHADRVGMIYTRTYTGLKGITDAMDLGISRTLAQGLAEGRGPKDIARSLLKEVDDIGVRRAMLLARTEVMRAHHVASINTYRQAGVEGVRVKAEFSLADDERVCERCAELDGKVFTLDAIEALIPVHPNCRCVALPELV
jgi:SPP1 gp7 family putative phage head morphogenesis protein